MADLQKIKCSCGCKFKIRWREYKEGDKFPCPNPECTKIFTITGFTESVTVTFKGSSGSDNAFSDLAGLFPF